LSEATKEKPQKHSFQILGFIVEMWDRYHRNKIPRRRCLGQLFR